MNRKKKSGQPLNNEEAVMDDFEQFIDVGDDESSDRSDYTGKSKFALKVAN